jgi:transposase
MPKKATPITPDEERRRRALVLVRRGVSQAEVARRLEVRRQSVSRWVKQAEKGGRGWWRQRPRGSMGMTPALAKRITAWLRSNRSEIEPRMLRYGRQQAIRMMREDLSLGRAYSPNHFSRLVKTAGISCPGKRSMYWF